MSNTTRPFDYRDDKSSKFWEVTQTDNTVTVRYGKTGTNGQSQDKTFADATAADKHAAKLIAEKTGKGYVERGSVQPVQAASVDEPEVTAEPADGGTPPSAEPQTKKTSTKTSQTSAKAVKPAKAAKPKNPAQNPEATPDSLLALLDKDDATNRLLARHPRASAELLEKLSHSSDKATRQGVAGNPNTAPEVYVKLGQQFPQEFLANPALDLLLMINPGLMEEVPQALLIRLLKQADCPASLLTWAAGHSQAKVQLAVAMNAKAAEEALAKLRVSEHDAVREAVGAPQCSPELAQDPEKAFEQAVKDRLGSMSGGLHGAWSEGDIGLAQWSALPLAFRLEKVTYDRFGDEAILSILSHTNWTFEAVQHALAGYQYWSEFAQNPRLPVAVLEALAKEEDISVRCSVAKNPSTPVSVLEELARDQQEIVRWELTQNPSMPQAIRLAVLGAFASEADEWTRLGVARLACTPPTLLESLASDSHAYVRKAVAENPRTPATVLDVLAMDKDSEVRDAVACNPTTPVATLESLANDKNKWVSRSVAWNPSTPLPVRDSILEGMSKDKDIDVRIKVAENPSTPLTILEALAKDKNSNVRINVAENPSTHAAALEVLAKDKDIDVRIKIAENPSTPVSVLEELAKDKDDEVRESVADNPSTPVSVLEELAQDMEESVRKSVAKHPSTPVTALDTLAKDKDSDVRDCIAKNPRTSPDALKKLATDKVVEVLLGVVRNSNTPLSALLPLVKAKSANVRRALASHAHRSEEICHTLLKDTDAGVRRAVISNQELASFVLDELAKNAACEVDCAELLAHPNLSAQSAQLLADKLLTTPAVDSPWYQHELSKANTEVAAAAQAQAVLSYFGKDPNKAVLAKRPLAAIMALCAGPFVEPSRIVKVAGSTDWLVRAAVARNAGTPPNLMKKLAADAHPLVALVARATTQSTENVPAQDLAQSQASLDLLRATKEVVRRIPFADNRENSALSNQFVTDDVWVEQLSAGLIAWMSALAQNPLTLQVQRMLDPKQAALLLELAVTYERASESLGSRARMWAAADPSCPINVLQDLANDEDTDIVLAVLGNTTFPQEEKELVQKRLLKLRGNQLLALLKNKSVPSDILVAKSMSKDESVRMEVAKNPSTPATLLEALAKDKDGYWVRRGVAENPSTPLPVLERLAKDSGDSVRSSVAKHPSTSAAILEALAKDSARWVLSCVAQNPSTPLTVLEKLAKDKYKHLRPSFAVNPAMPVAVLEELAKDTDNWVRRSVAENPSTPVAVLDVLAKDTDDGVRRSVAKNPSTPVAVLEILAIDTDNWVRRTVCENPSTPSRVLGILAMDAGSNVRALVAANASAHAAVLEELAKETDSTIRLCVARNPNTPLPVLRDLAEDESLEVRGSVALRGGQHTEFLDRFIAWWHSRLQRALDRESRLRAGGAPEPVTHVQPDDLLRALYRLGLISPTDDNKALTQASRSKDWLTRLGAALHPGASEGILKLLRKDADPDVAKAASRRAAGSTTAA